MTKPLITITSDFGVQSHGVGVMEAVALEINPDANVVHLAHGLPDFDLAYGARTLESVFCTQIGYHVCGVDPGVGTSRKPIIIETKRGDFLIRPDNGVLIPATRFLNGIKKAVEIRSPKYMKNPVSPIFHGRDIFTPAAAYLSTGIMIEEFGPELKTNELAKAPYEEAEILKGAIKAKVIAVNKFGSLHLNIMHKEWDKFVQDVNKPLKIQGKKMKINLPVGSTFGEVKKWQDLIMKDDFGRVEIATNQGSFVKKHKLKIGDEIKISK